MPIQKLRPTYTFDEDRLAALKAVLPEAFADGQINWDTLRDLLGDRLEDEGNDAEHFGLTWPGKRQARRLAGQPSKGTLIPAPGEGVDEANTRNLFIEGDNLEVLKLLQKSYAGRVKLIYIDPPYNTGNDFIYPDDYSEPLESYLKRTGEMGEGGELLTTNPKSDGRFHSNWLNMMYPRLRLARNLLRDDGVIFVSIDDGEVANLRLLMDEVFGAENFLANVIWEKVYSSRMDSQGFSSDHDHILAYGQSDEFVIGSLDFEQNIKQFSNLDKKTGKNYRRRSWRKEGKGARRIDRPNLFYPLPSPDGAEIWPIRPDGTEGRWRGAMTHYKKLEAQGEIEWVQRSGEWQVYVKQFYDNAASKPPGTIWTHTEAGHNHEAVDKLKSIFGELVFDNPKPPRLLKRMLDLGTVPTDEDNIVLDFFSGSCTTAQAVLEQNREDNGNRRFIMVQLPEPTSHKKFFTIAEIGKERIRRVITQIKKDAKGKLDLSTRETPEDLGFKVFKLARSNFKPWDDYEGEDTPQLELRFDEAETPLVPGWQAPDLLTEVILQQGFPLDSVVTPLAQFKANHIVAVESDFLDYRLVVCLDRAISDATTESLTLAPEDIFVCLDSALSDQAKARLSDICNLNVI